MAVLATEDYQPLLDTARDKGMTARYVWVTLDSAKGALASDGVFMWSRQPTVSLTLKGFKIGLLERRHDHLQQVAPWNI
jgi:hypothetical protein